MCACVHEHQQLVICEVQNPHFVSVLHINSPWSIQPVERQHMGTQMVVSMKENTGMEGGTDMGS